MGIIGRSPLVDQSGLRVSIVTIHDLHHLQALVHSRLGEYAASTMLITEAVGGVPASQALSDCDNVCFHASMTHPLSQSDRS